jgi:tRNA wybutosine-synthesizing protein 3
MGIALDSLIGFHADGRQVCAVSEGSLRTLLEIANDRFRVNATRIAKFRELLIQSMSTDTGPRGRDGEKEWEDVEVRRERKRAEGLRRKETLRDSKKDPIVEPQDIAGLEFFP